MLTATATGAIDCAGCTLEVIIRVIVGAISRANSPGHWPLASGGLEAFTHGLVKQAM